MFPSIVQEELKTRVATERKRIEEEMGRRREGEMEELRRDMEGTTLLTVMCHIFIKVVMLLEFS